MKIRERRTGTNDNVRRWWANGHAASPATLATAAAIDLSDLFAAATTTIETVPKQ
jgi:hypothetical protein